MRPAGIVLPVFQARLMNIGSVNKAWIHPRAREECKRGVGNVKKPGHDAGVETRIKQKIVVWRISNEIRNWVHLCS